MERRKVFINITHNQNKYLRIFLTFAVGGHLFDLNAERGGVGCSVGRQAERVERPERNAELGLGEHVVDGSQRAEDEVGLTAGTGVRRKSHSDNLRAIEAGGA